MALAATGSGRLLRSHAAKSKFSRSSAISRELSRITPWILEGLELFATSADGRSQHAPVGNREFDFGQIVGELVSGATGAVGRH